jgi:D-alanyl-D-alanine carboxypeptidase
LVGETWSKQKWTSFGWRMYLKRILAVFIALAFIFSDFGLVAASDAAKRRSNNRFAALTVDARTGTVLFAENPDAQRYPASLTKMMTLYIVFQELKAGRIKLSSPLTVSARAARMPPSKLGLKPGTSITVEHAIKALVVKSANDVAAVVGENLGGSENNFAERMTRQARDLGMSRTVYRNASGLPNPGQVTTARDQATLGLRLMRDFPQYYPYFRLQGFNYKGRTIRTHNRLVGRFPGTDGMKTGYINASGYNLVTSTRRGDRRLVGVVLGGSTASRRNAYMMAMMNKHFGKAKDGRTIAALAGSAKGAMDPIALANAANAASEPELPSPQQAAKVAELSAAAADESGEESTEEQSGDMDDAELAEIAKASGGNPQVVKAEITPMATPSSELPFEVKEEVGSKDSDWNIQVGIFRTKKAAEGELTFLRGKIKSLDGREGAALPVTAKNKRFYRARFIGFDQNEAIAICNTVKKLGAACLPLNPRG